VIGVAVDNQNFNLGSQHADLVKLARGAYGRPKTSESGAEDKNARHVSLSEL
jgi:hypothetical protein